MENISRMRQLIATALVVPALTLAACSGSDDNNVLDQFDKAPEGVDLTKPGSVLDFGSSAQIVNPGIDGDPNTYFEITVSGVRTISRAEAEANAEGEFTGDNPPEKVTCFDYTIKYLGSDGDVEYVNDPDLSPITKDGGLANNIWSDDNKGCGISEDETLPGNSEDIKPNHEYRGAVMSFEDSDGAFNAVGVEYEYKEYQLNDVEDDEDLTISWK